jgi:hypothetical protein
MDASDHRPQSKPDRDHHSGQSREILSCRARLHFGARPHAPSERMEAWRGHPDNQSSSVQRTGGGRPDPRRLCPSRFATNISGVQSRALLCRVFPRQTPSDDPYAVTPHHTVGTVAETPFTVSNAEEEAARRGVTKKNAR